MASDFYKLCECSAHYFTPCQYNNLYLWLYFCKFRDSGPIHVYCNLFTNKLLHYNLPSIGLVNSSHNLCDQRHRFWAEALDVSFQRDLLQLKFRLPNPVTNVFWNILSITECACCPDNNVCVYSIFESSYFLLHFAQHFRRWGRPSQRWAQRSWYY